MKLRLLALSFFIVLMSCSSDDGSEPLNENPNPEQPSVPVDKVMIQTEEIYNDDYYYKRLITQYEDERPVSNICYDFDDDIFTTGTYTYNDEGNVIFTEVLNGDGTFNNSSEYHYDNQGRLTDYIISSQHYEMNMATNYIYNEDNTITATRVYTQMEVPDYVTTFFLNEDGKINKIKKEYNNDYNQRVEAELNSQGENIVSVVSLDDFGVYTLWDYTYNYVQEVKGGYLERFHLYGCFNNSVLRAESFIADYVMVNYLSSYVQQNGEDNYNIYQNNFTYMYEFDDYGYPLNVKKYLNGDLGIETIISYE